MFEPNRRSAASPNSKAIKDLIRFAPTSEFLKEHRRAALLTKIGALSGLDASSYAAMCHELIETLVDYCQNLPQTSNSFYAHAGGLVDHALNRTEAALGLFDEFMIRDASNLLSEPQKLWQYALFTAAILQGIGKLYVDYQVHLYDRKGQVVKQWNPLIERLVATGYYYDYEFQNEPEAEFRKRLNLLLAKSMMPIKGFSWIASQPDVLATWLALLHEDPLSSGTLGAILIRAEAIAVQRYLLEEQPRGVAGHTGPCGRAGTFSGVVPETPYSKEQVVGIEFIKWLMNALEGGKIMINKAPLFMVPGGMLMCQEIFQFFVRQHPEYRTWQAVQKGFLSLGLCSKNSEGSFMQRFAQTNNRAMVRGILFSQYAIALPGSVRVVPPNSLHSESCATTEFIHQTHFTQQNGGMKEYGLRKLSPAGAWQLMNHGSAFMPGASRGG